MISVASTPLWRKSGWDSTLYLSSVDTSSKSVLRVALGSQNSSRERGYADHPLRAGRVYDYSYCIGHVQSGRAGDFGLPQDFVLGSNGRIYVLSRGVEQLGQRVTKINFDHEFQGQFGSRRRGRRALRLAPVN